MRQVFSFVLLILILCGSAASPAYSEEPLSLSSYLASMDGGEVAFEGQISYAGERQGFVLFYGDSFFVSVSIDAGRDQRLKVQDQCAGDGFGFDFDSACFVSGLGRVDIVGSDIRLSIETISKLESS